MSSNAEFVRTAYTALTTGDMAVVESLLSPDVIWHTRGWGPLTGDYLGKAAVMELVTEFVKITEGSSRAEVETFLEDGNRVVAIMSSIQDKPHYHVSKHVDIWDLKDGMIIEFWGIQADQQAGALAFI